MQKVLSIFGLIITFFSFFLLFVFTPFLVYEVFQASDSEIIKAEVVDSYFGYERNFSREYCHMEIEFKILGTNKNITIIDAVPGDITTCYSKRKLHALYPDGYSTIILLTKNGDYYLSHGSYFKALKYGIFSLIWFIFLYAYIKKYAKKESPEKP